MSNLDLIKSYLGENNIPTNQAARGAGISPAAVSQYLNNKYAGDSQSVENALLSFIEAQKEKVKSVPLVGIDAFCRINSVAKVCRANGKLAVICGRAGTGKTTASKSYAENNHGTVYVCADMSVNAQDLFAELCETLGIGATYSLRNNFKNAKNRLAGTGRLIIIDEAEHLSYKALDLLRSLYDATGCGLMLVGTEILIHNLRGRRGEYEQLFSRVSIYQKTTALNLADVEMFVASAAPASKRLAATYLKNCGANMRILANLVSECVRIAELNKCEIDKNVIETAADGLVTF